MEAYLEIGPMDFDEFRAQLLNQARPQDYMGGQYRHEDGWYRTGFFCTRDSRPLEELNYDTVSEDLQRRFPETVAAEKSTHWGPGWISELLVQKDDEQALLAVYYWWQRIYEQDGIADTDAYTQMLTERWTEESKEGGSAYNDCKWELGKLANEKRDAGLYSPLFLLYEEQDPDYDLTETASAKLTALLLADLPESSRYAPDWTPSMEETVWSQEAIVQMMVDYARELAREQGQYPQETQPDSYEMQQYLVRQAAAHQIAQGQLTLPLTQEV